ncbi:MFS transporter [Nocardioides seonyuensis]|uniref:Tetracycline resistance protein n=1 Tax=Nocardioides seonyuensis TaxID=2518371 RepID=A0A4P7IFB7_9ACTN|nr:MFS transporter [Nocardioides seonyuensis]QBX55969.1 MFS transporter [Nocardioides seonyuensis]
MSEARDARRVSLLLGLLFGLAGMGSSSAAIALPAVADEFGASIGVAAWTISGYVLMLAVATPIYGRVSDLVGVRIPLLVGVGLMTLGALGATVATSFELLLVARLLQGAGAAAVPTLGVTLISARYDGRVRSGALGRLAAVAAAVSCVGPLLGGAVEHVLDWRAVMALPICGLLVLPLIWQAVAGDGSRARLDLLGAALVAATSAGLVMIVQSPSAGRLVGLIGTVLCLLGAPLVARRVRHHPHGFLPATVIRNPTVIRSAVVGATVPASWFALLIGVPAALVGHGWEPWRVGLLLLPSAGVALLMPKVAAHLLERHGGTRVLAMAAMTSSVSLVVGALGTAQTAPIAVGVAVMLTTASFGFGQPAMITAVGDAVHDDVRGAALGIATLLFLVGGSIGSAVVAGLGEPLGIPGSLLVLALLPLVALVTVIPGLGRAAKASELSEDR